MIIAITAFLIFFAAAAFVGLRYGMLKRMLMMLLVVSIVLGVIFGLKMYGFHQMMAQMQSMDMRQTVSSAKATSEDWQAELSAVGSLRAAKGVDISNELAGIVEELHFTSGGDVKAGTLMVELRAEDDIAKLHTLEASLRLAEINYKRDKAQLKAQAVAQATVDNDAANLDSARAQVAEQKAIVGKKFIRAPFSGHVGIRNIDIGQYLTPGTAIVTLQQLDPIYLDFNMPQQSLSQIKTGQKITVKNDTWPGRVFKGKIAAINPRVDTATRNVMVRAEISNRDHALLPGMYATIGITVGDATPFVTVPQTAITYNPYGDTVYILHEKEGEKDAKGEKPLIAEQTFVTVGRTRGDQVQILKNVNEGDTIVTSGQLKLQNGSSVIINNAAMPKNDPNPQPQEQ